jgi:hypothetical protein
MTVTKLLMPDKPEGRPTKLRSSGDVVSKGRGTGRCHLRGALQPVAGGAGGGDAGDGGRQKA